MVRDAESNVCKLGDYTMTESCKAHGKIALAVFLTISHKIKAKMDASLKITMGETHLSIFF